MLKKIVMSVCIVNLETPVGDLAINLELVVFRNTSSRNDQAGEAAAKTTRRLQAYANYRTGTDYYAYADVTDLGPLPARVEEIAETEIVADLIEGVVTGLYEKALVEGERTGKAFLGPPTYLTAEHLEDVLRQLRADRAQPGGQGPRP